MADDVKDKSTNEIIQALDALSKLNQARAIRRTTSLASPRSGSAKDGDDARAVDAAVKEARPRSRLHRRSSLTSSSWSKPKLDKNENDDEEEGDDSALIIIIKSQGLSAEAVRPQSRRRFSVTLPLQSRSKMGKKEDDEAKEDDDDYSTHSALLKSQGFAASTPEADGDDNKAVMSWGPIRARSHLGMRRMGCLFSVEVVAAQGLPQSMNGQPLAVTMRKKDTRDGAVQTKPARVQLGAAYFDETLYVRCQLYGIGEPRPFLLSLIAIDAPELDFGRSTVDLSLFAKEFADKYQQGECVRQWDMVFPLAGKAKGGELVVKLAFQGIDTQPAGQDKASFKMLSPKIRSSEGQKVADKRRKLRRSSVSNMLTPKMARTKTRGIDNFKLDEPEDEPTPVEEVKETQQEEPESVPTGHEVKEEEKQSEPVDEPTPVTEVEEEEGPEREPADVSTPVTEVAEEEEEQQKEPECELADELTAVTEVKEEQQKEPEREPADDSTVATEVKQEEQQKESEREPADEPTGVTEVKEEEQQKESEIEPADEPTAVTEVKEEEQPKEPESEPAEEPTPMTEMKEEDKQKEPEHEPIDEPTPVTEVQEEEQQKQPEREPKDAPEDAKSEQPELDKIDKNIEGQQVKADLAKEEKAEAKIGSEEEASLVVDDEVANHAVANGLEEKSVEAAMPSSASDAVADAVEPVDVEAARPEDVIGESLQAPEQGEDKGTAAKPPRRQPRFKWRTIALLVPLSVLVSNTLGVKG